MNWERTHRTEIQMRFGDVDSPGHVSNVAYAQYLETARLAFLRLAFLGELLKSAAEARMMQARVNKAERRPEPLSLPVRVSLEERVAWMTAEE